MEKLFLASGILGLALVVDMAIILWWAFGLSVMWSWFVVPLGVPAIGVTWAAGLLICSRFLKPVAPPKVDNYGQYVFGAVIVVPLTLLLGWLVK